MKKVFLLIIIGTFSFPTLSQNVGKCVINLRSSWGDNYTSMDCAISHLPSKYLIAEGTIKSDQGRSERYSITFSENLTKKWSNKDNSPIKFSLLSLRGKEEFFYFTTKNSTLDYKKNPKSANSFELRIRIKGGSTEIIGDKNPKSKLLRDGLIFIEGEFIK